MGTTIGHVLKDIGNDYAVRSLSPNEQTRIGGVIIYAINKIEENRKKGMNIRQDDFFKERPGERSSAKEITEGILLAAQREYEEKKIRFYGNLLANLGFTPISRAQANLCLKISQGLTYRQLCLLATIGQHYRFELRENNYHEQNTMDPEVASVLHEISELEILNLITQGNAVLGLTDISPRKMRLEGRGVTLFHLMELSKMDDGELAEPIALLR